MWYHNVHEKMIPLLQISGSGQASIPFDDNSAGSGIILRIDENESGSVHAVQRQGHLEVLRACSS